MSSLTKSFNDRKKSLADDWIIQRCQKKWRVSRIFRTLKKSYPKHSDSLLLCQILRVAKERGTPITDQALWRVIRKDCEETFESEVTNWFLSFTKRSYLAKQSAMRYVRKRDIIKDSIDDGTQDLKPEILVDN